MKINTRQITLIALFVALCVLIPLLFHAAGLGKMFLPMFIPILLAGFVLEPSAALRVGFAGPWISSLLTGMPPMMPTALSMSVEGMVTAGLASYLYHSKKVSFWICLILAIVGQRLARIVMLFIILPFLGLPARSLSLADFTYSLPGIIVQLVLIPVIVNILWKLKFMERT